MKNPRRGVALVLVMMTLALMSVLAIEIIFASRVDLRIGRNARDRLQASYLAQSALRFSLLRLYLYREVKNRMDGAAAQPGMTLPNTITDKIWSMPLPNLPLPGMEVSWPGEMMSRIDSEGSKIPINLLDGNKSRGSGTTQVENVRKQIENVVKGLSEDETFDKQYRGLAAKDLIDPLQDWIDADSEKLGGGDESSEYSRFDPPYMPRNDRISTLGELHMIQGWTDDLIEKVGRNFSVFNSSLDVNPNYMSLDRIRSLCPQLVSEELQVIQKKRLETPFGTLADLQNFITTSPDIKNGRNCNFGELKDSKRETVFTIEGTGVVGEARRTFKMAVRFMESPAPKAAPGAASTPSPANPSNSNPTSPTTKTKLLDPVVLTIEEDA